MEVVIDGRVIEVRRPRDPEEYCMISSTVAKVWGVLDRFVFSESYKY